jgi:hypothetical protein
MVLKGLLTMSTKELERLSLIEKVIDKLLSQMMAALQLGLTVRQIKRLVRKYRLWGRRISVKTARRSKQSKV